jgi:DNA polymerase-4
VTDAEVPVRHVRKMVAQIHEETGLQYSVGIGPNKLCAKVLSELNKPAAFNVASREQCCELFADASPRIIPGIGPKSVEALTSLGISTISALRDFPHPQLAAAFGERRASELGARSRFEHDGKVQAERILRSKSEERTFETDVDDLAELIRRMQEISAELCQQLSSRELRGRTIGIKVRLADFTTITRARTLDQFTNSYSVISEVATELLRVYDPQQPVRLIGVRIASFEHELNEVETEDHASPLGVQLQLMDTRKYLRPRPRDVS